MGIISMIIVGLIAGLLARAIMPGDDPMGWIATILLGIVGSFVGGFLASMFLGRSTAHRQRARAVGHHRERHRRADRAGDLPDGEATLGLTRRGGTRVPAPF